MQRWSLANSGFERITKRTRKREFRDEMNLVVPWAELIGLIAPHARVWRPIRETQNARRAKKNHPKVAGKCSVKNIVGNEKTSLVEPGCSVRTCA